MKDGEIVGVCYEGGSSMIRSGGDAFMGISHDQAIKSDRQLRKS